MTLYETIFETFLAKIEDYLLAKNIEERPAFVFNEVTTWLKSASVKTKRFITKTITFDDLSSSIVEDIDALEVEVFALGMITEWLRPRLYSVINTNQIYAGKEEKFYSQANHISALRDLFKDSKVEVKKIIRDYGYQNNSYLSG